MLERPDELGGEAVVRLRVPRGSRRRGRAPLRRATASPRASRPWSTRRPRRDAGGARPSRSGTRRRATAGCSRAATPATRGSTALGVDPARRRRRGRLRALARPGRARLAPRLGRLRDLPRPLRLVAASTPTRPTGRSGAAGTSCRPAAGRRRRASSTAATSRGVERASRPRRAARRERPLPDAVLPGGQHAPLRRDVVRAASTRCSAATRRSRR